MQSYISIENTAEFCPWWGYSLALRSPQVWGTGPVRSTTWFPYYHRVGGVPPFSKAYKLVSSVIKSFCPFWLFWWLCPSRHDFCHPPHSNRQDVLYFVHKFSAVLSLVKACLDLYCRSLLRRCFCPCSTTILLSFFSWFLDSNLISRCTIYIDYCSMCAWSCQGCCCSGLMAATGVISMILVWARGVAA